MNEELLSVCCGTPQVGDYEICVSCGEHTVFEDGSEEE